MKVALSEWHDKATCVWCEKERECVSTTFSDGFLNKAAMCWKCLQTAFKVRSRQKPDRAEVDSSSARPPETR